MVVTFIWAKFSKIEKFYYGDWNRNFFLIINAYRTLYGKCVRVSIFIKHGWRSLHPEEWKRVMLSVCISKVMMIKLLIDGTLEKIYNAIIN